MLDPGEKELHGCWDGNRARSCHHMIDSHWSPTHFCFRESTAVKDTLVDRLRRSSLYPFAKRLKRWGMSKNPLSRTRQEADIEAAAGFYRQFIEEGDLCFDIGAHQGVRTDVFLTLGARVVAVEPQEELIEFLRHKYHGEAPVVIIPMGLAKREGEATLFVCSYSTCSSMSAEWIDAVKDWERLRNREWKTTRSVRVTTMDRLIGEYGKPAFCKIDVEGFEWQVLQGLSQPVRALSLE